MATAHCDDQRIYEFGPTSTAMIVIDFQRDFVEVEGGCGDNDAETRRLASVIPAANRALVSARNARMTIVHTRESYSSDMSDVSPAKLEMNYVGVEGPLGRCLIRGEPGCNFSPLMKPEPDEHVIDKPGFSAFFETDLQDFLRDREISSLVITGVTYQCCVHSTTRDAVERGYRCLTLDDCCAAATPELEEAARQIIRSEGNLFGWIARGIAFKLLQQL